MSHSGSESKARALESDDGNGNVVDHHASHGMLLKARSSDVCLKGLYTVTDDAPVPVGPRRTHAGAGGIVTVQPLKRSEMQITNPYRAAFGISDLRQALVERAQTTLRHVVGARAVQSVVTEREAIAYEIAEIVGDVADKWGVAIEGILIKDIIFSAEVAASLSSAAQQKRIGESKVIAARAEVDAARLMRQAADILASPAAMQIRQLEALQTMAKSSGSKVIFVPMQLQSDVAGKLANQASGSDVGAILQSETDEGGVGSASRAGLLNSMASL
ncbi:hypothetical protein C0989_002780 [Termitomyces sp. Mn162]|nr:hypothetical protein C0989_002780 [Termitomyces sp. Mn162]